MVSSAHRTARVLVKERELGLAPHDEAASGFASSTSAGGFRMHARYGIKSQTYGAFLEHFAAEVSTLL
jgi:hypothetical protein